MSLNILCAGCSVEERVAVEAALHAALDECTRRDPWTVSLVKFGAGWSVTLDGRATAAPRRSFMVPSPAGAQVVAQAVRSAVDPGATLLGVPSAVRHPAAVAAEPQGRRDAHTCGVCGRAYVLVYDAEPDEPLEDAPVACPHCWQICRVQVTRSASIGRDYRADKA